MTYKSILVHADASQSALARFRIAAQLARRFDAHLSACAPTGISRFLPPDVLVREGTPLAECCAAMRANAADALRSFAQVASQEGVALVEERMIDDDAGGIALHARYADLVVVSQPDQALPTRGSASELPGYLLRECGRPLLIVPREAGAAGLEGDILFAWDGSVEATRALIAALPLMRTAPGVGIVHVDDGRAWPDEARASAQAMLQYLRRQGVAAQVCRHQGGRFDVAGALLSAAAETGAGLLVMGGYGRSPLHESLLGGVSAAVLRSMTLPVLLAH